MGIKYLCSKWQGLLQMIIYLISRGYYFYCLVYLPENKKGKWEQIDIKLIEKYGTHKSKWQRSRLKGKGIANFYYLRWDRIAIILHTQGEIPVTVNYDDKFMDVRKKPMSIKLSDITELIVWLEKYKVNKTEMCKVSVKLGSKTYADLKAKLLEAALTKNKSRMKMEFNKINGIPAWGGIIEQKKALAKFLCNQAGRNQVALSQKELRIIKKRFPVKVFEGDDDTNAETAE